MSQNEAHRIRKRGSDLADIRRRNTSKACNTCRRRRAKCDGVKPSCSRCQSRGTQCEYTEEEDGRRPAPKSYVNLMRQRIELLENTLRLHHIDVDAATTRTSSMEGPGGAMTGQQTSSKEADRVAHHWEARSSHRSDQRLRGILALDAAMNFDQDGEARYFGPTSGRLEFRPAEGKSYDERDWNFLQFIHYEVYLTANSTSFPGADGRDQTNTITGSSLAFNRFYQDIVSEENIPRELEDHLIDLYFTWEQPWCQLVNEPLFRDSRDNNGPYYDPLLLNCILCMGSRFSDRSEVRSVPTDPSTAGRLFLEKAEVLLYYELKRPRITTVQALCLLSTAYIAFGYDATGWLHEGMAGRLALDLGLNIDSASLTGPRALSHEEVNLRRQLFWALFCNDKLSASYTGRVCTFLELQSAVEMPQIQQISIREHVQDSMIMRYEGLSTLQSLFVNLCRRLEKILLELYAPGARNNMSQAESFFSSCILSLKNWYYDLPESLRLERVTANDLIPQVCTLHMVYHTSFILLTKPFLIVAHGKDTRHSSIATEEQGTIRTTAEEARKVSFKAAIGVCEVARRYRSTFGSFRRSPITALHCTLSAALILLNAHKSRWKEVNSLGSVQRDIELCLQVLEELGCSWSPAGRIAENVRRLYQWVRSQNKQSGERSQSSKRNPPSASHDTQPPFPTDSPEANPQWLQPSPGSLDSTSDADFNAFLDSLWTTNGLYFTEDDMGFQFDPFADQSSNLGRPDMQTEIWQDIP